MIARFHKNEFLDGAYFPLADLAKLLIEAKIESKLLHTNSLDFNTGNYAPCLLVMVTTPEQMDIVLRYATDISDEPETPTLPAAIVMF